MVPRCCSILLVVLWGAGSVGAQEERFETWPEPPAWPEAEPWPDGEPRPNDEPWPVVPEDPIPRGREVPEPSEPPGPCTPVDYAYDSVIQLEAFWIPTLGLRADVDPGEEDEDLAFETDVRTGSGMGARIGFGDPVSFGLLYLFGEHTERSADATLHTHAAYLEVLVGGALNEGPLELTLHVGAGLGGAVFDFAEGFDDTGGAAFELRGLVGLRVFEHVELQAGGGWFHWGYPGESLGDGGFAQFGLSLRF